MVNQQAFVQTIHNLTGNDTSTELAQFCRRWLEDNSDKLSIAEADRFLNSLTPANNPSMFTLGSVCILICKMQKIKSDQSCLEFVAQLQNQIPCFDVRQLQWAPDIFNRLFENIADFMLRRNLSLWAIPLLETAILTFCRGNPSQLTNLHCTLFCLCLKARHFDRAMPFLKINVTELFKQSDAMALISAGKKKDGDKSNGVSSSENSHPHPQQQQSSSSASSITSSVGSFLQKAVNTVSGSLGTKSDEPKPSLPLFKKRSVLLYFYYGALIFGALEQWEEAALFLEHAICLPTKKTSFIVLESLKKFILISLIIGRKKPLDFLPTYRTPPVQRTLLTLASTYMKLPALIDRTLGQKNDVATALTVYWGENRAIFSRDQNAGLMKVLINVCRENALKRLSNIFVSLQLGDVCRMAHLPVPSGENIGAEEESVEQIILRLRRNHQLTAHIDGRTQTVVFEEKDTLMGQDGTVGPTEMDIDTAMEEVIGLARTIRSFDDAIRLNPHFIEKTLQKVKDRRLPGGGGNGGGGAHGSGSIFPEDEGFFLTGSP